ncbi:MAG TPA: DUF4926 domain-containing protein [Chloroflexota bacterium]|nr:DUF4926 domain-containing protein [Chloroflexota bacterium]HUM71606.1 DUF4926 domain-containing protein [Chloroflexota bacterium]
MKLELYKEVALTKDIPAENLCKGDVATLIDIIPHPSGGEDGAVLELFNAVGESIAVTAVPLSAIAPLRPDQMPAVRPLLEAVV